jgi:hypothetical protein
LTVRPGAHDGVANVVAGVAMLTHAFLPSLRLFFGRPCAFKGELRIYPGVDYFDIYDGPFP